MAVTDYVEMAARRGAGCRNAEWNLSDLERIKLGRRGTVS